jgi:hypothetical protein
VTCGVSGTIKEVPGEKRASAAVTPVVIWEKHERRDGLTERLSFLCVLLRSAIAPSVWPCHSIQNHLNYENLGFSQFVTRVIAAL